MKLFEYDVRIGEHRVLCQTRDLRDGAITTPKIADEAVTAEKLAPGSVGHEQLAPKAVADLSRLENELQGLTAEIARKIEEAEALAREIAELKGTINEELIESLPFLLKGGYKVIPVSTSITSDEMPSEGRETNVMFVNTSRRELTVTIPSSSYKTPLGTDIVLLVPVGGYAEANFANIGGVVYVRGV